MHIKTESEKVGWGTGEWVAPVNQPRKPRTFDEMLSDCVMAVVTHDQPRKLVASVFAEQDKGIAFHQKRS